MWTNYHTHTKYCDGTASVMEVVSAAATNGLTGIGLSSHAPMPYPEFKWAMKASELDNYLGDIHNARSAFPTIEVYAGLELDFFDGRKTFDDFKNVLDYTIGSIHLVETLDGIPWEVDGGHELFLRGLTEVFNNNIEDAVTRYYELTREMITMATPDIVGHLDKIKIQNEHGLLFSEGDKWYQQQVICTLDTIAQAGCILEVNTRGIYQKKSITPYPSPWILELARHRDIPVTLSSDAHHPKDLTSEFSETAKLLYTLGFRTVSVLRNGSWTTAKLAPDGIE
jgi:histidinol-phosphatase (PHP family)